MAVVSNDDDGVNDLRRRRLRARLSQERLARLADCSTSTVRLAERGWFPSTQIMDRLAAALKCEPEALYVRVEQVQHGDTTFGDAA